MVVTPLPRSCDTARTMSEPSPGKTWTEAVAPATLVQPKSLEQRTWTAYVVSATGASWKNVLALQSCTRPPFRSKRNCATPPTQPPDRAESNAETRIGEPVVST